MFQITYASSSMVAGCDASRFSKASIQRASELKKSPTNVMAGSQGKPVAILNHNRVMAYMLDPKTYETMLERLDDQALVEIINARSGEVGIPVEIDDL